MTIDSAGRESDLLDKANTLMRRHRSFVAKSPEALTANASVTPAVAAFIDTEPADQTQADEDIPVLTEVVASDALADLTADEQSAQEPMVAVSWANAQIQRWIDEELPTVVLSVLDGVADRLVAEMVNRAQADLLDKIAAGPVDAEQGPTMESPPS